MKKTLIVVLLGVNAALLVALLAGTGADKAYGQVIGANYLVVTGNIFSDTDAVYVLDLATRRLGAWRFERRNKPFGFRPVGRGRQLLADFGRAAE